MGRGRVQVKGSGSSCGDCQREANHLEGSVDDLARRADRRECGC